MLDDYIDFHLLYGEGDDDGGDNEENEYEDSVPYWIRRFGEELMKEIEKTIENTSTNVHPSRIVTNTFFRLVRNTKRFNFEERAVYYGLTRLAMALMALVSMMSDYVGDDKEEDKEPE